MKSRVILSAVGTDRPGLTQALADAVLGAGGNWLESHLSRLGGKYVGSVLVEIEEEARPALQRAVEEVDSIGLHVFLVSAGDEPPAEHRIFAVEVVGQDRPGIVREVTSALAKLRVNIEEFATRLENMSWSGGTLFHLNARVAAPPGTSSGQIREALEGISGEMMVDIESEPGAATHVDPSKRDRQDA